MPTLGETLRAAREEQRIKLAQAAERTKIPLERLQALESDRYLDLPDDVYLNGAIRNYALFLGLDPTETVQLYRAARPAVVRAAPLSTTSTRRTVAVVPAAVATVIIIVIILIVLFALGII